MHEQLWQVNEMKLWVDDSPATPQLVGVALEGKVVSADWGLFYLCHYNQVMYW